MPGVLRFSEAASIGIHAMILMASNPGAPVTCREISDSFEVSDNHTQKVMQRLVKAGLAASVRGPGGGYRINGNPASITLLDVYETLDGPLGTDTCLFQRNHCPPEGCLLGGMLSEVDSVVKRHLAGTYLSEFAAGAGRRSG